MNRHRSPEGYSMCPPQDWALTLRRGSVRRQGASPPKIFSTPAAERVAWTSDTQKDCFLLKSRNTYSSASGELVHEGSEDFGS